MVDPLFDMRDFFDFFFIKIFSFDFEILKKNKQKLPNSLIHCLFVYLYSFTKQFRSPLVDHLQ